MNTQNSTPAASPRRFAGWSKAVGAIVLAGALVGSGVTAAQAASYPGSAPKTLTVSGTGVSGSAAAGYTVDLGASSAPGATSGTLAITVSGTGLQPTSQPFPASGAALYQPGDTVPTYSGIYASVGKATGLPVSDGVGTSGRSAAQTWWIHEGTQNRVQPGSEAAWTNFSAGSFSVSYSVPWSYDTGTNTLTLGTSTVPSGGAGDFVFQAWTQNGVGAPDIDNERAVNLTLDLP